jgi:hypothetical protein
VSHWAEVDTWVAGLAWAFWLVKPPLWQVEQLLEETGPTILLCMVETPTEIGLNVTPAEWQASQEAVVEMCVADFPVARAPLWQVAQAPGTARAWV